MRSVLTVTAIALGIALSVAPAVAKNAQSSEVGKSFDCKLQNAYLNQQTGLVADPSAPTSNVYIWFGRFLIVSKALNGQPIPMIIDHDRIAAPIGASYRGVDEWPQKFRLKAEDPSGSRIFVVEGDKLDTSAPNAFKASITIWAPGAIADESRIEGRITGFMTGHCVAAANVLYTEYQKRASQ